MLRTTIQTTDEETGKELPIPLDLYTKVQRADEILAEMLHKVGEKFDIEARWHFDLKPGSELEVWLALWTEGEGGSFLFSKNDFIDDTAVRRGLRKSFGVIIPYLSKQVDRDFARIRHDLEILAATPVTATED